MAGEKHKKSKTKSDASIDRAAFASTAGTMHLPVQAPPTPAVTEEHAPVLSKPRKKKKKQNSTNDVENSPDGAGGGQTRVSEVDSSPLSGRQSSKSDDIRCDSRLDQQGGNGGSPGCEKVIESDNVVENLAQSPVESACDSQPKDPDAVKGSGKKVEWFNPARQEALEAVSDFKTRILERAAKQARNDTPFTPSPYPNDLYLYEKPDSTPEDKAMLLLKRSFDVAILELDPSLAPRHGAIPLNVAKRAAMYVSGLLKSHDAQFRCAVDSLRGSAAPDQPVAAPWIADMWEERLADSDRDWLLGKSIDDMSEEKASRHVGDMMEFIMKYKLWGQIVERECDDFGVGMHPRLN